MSQALDSLIAKIHSLSEKRCKNQMYVWPGFDPMDPDPGKFFKRLGIKFDGSLFISYPVKMTFAPLSKEELIQQERSLGVQLPDDYKELLQQFGPVHLPGSADVILQSPQEALASTRAAWCYQGKPLSVLSISSYNRTSDGNSIGFIRKGNLFGPEIYEFDHELLYHGDDPNLWTRKAGDSLAEFLLEYLNGQT
jgi:hypothetical protein